MLLHSCGGFPALPGRSRGLQGLQGPPGASRGLQALQGACGALKSPKKRKMHPAAYCQSLEPWARLKFHAGWSGWTRPPTMAGKGGGSAQVSAKGIVEGVFKGI